ncbi:calcium-binding and coiled-coil domain-containing protein 2-like [Gossypium hirsutum]|uniref:Calcium-binding and coiled-coil domain-containing protein 2-like n=1 Tax=Gossypium hirsutum TaxID=3635 RepID=A0A1U8M886_GOSHI|nr:calcium-binding and coiled-coil domain-containing protein 2-like [Gossypium hirsutum]
MLSGELRERFLHGLRQFVPVTQGLAQNEFVYKGADYKRKGVAINPATTPEYVEWRSRRINDNVPITKMEEVRPMEEYLQVIPSELDIMKQEFKRKNLELEKKIEKLEEEKMYLSLDVGLQKKEVGKWQKKVQKEKAKVEYWEKKCQEMRSQNLALEKENKGLKSKVTELGRSLRWHQNHDPTVELKELKGKVEDLEVALHDGELRIEQLKAQEYCLKQELHQVKGQVRDRDYIIGDAIAQIREVAEYVRDLAVRADALSMMYESASDKGRELALLLDKVRTLGLKAKAYM